MDLIARAQLAIGRSHPQADDEWTLAVARLVVLDYEDAETTSPIEAWAEYYASNIIELATGAPE